MNLPQWVQEEIEAAWHDRDEDDPHCAGSGRDEKGRSGSALRDYDVGDGCTAGSTVIDAR